MRGTANMGTPHATYALCEAAIRADAQARKTSANYRCVNTTQVRADWTPDPVIPTDPHNGGVQPGNQPRYNVASIPAPARGSSTFDVGGTGQWPYQTPGETSGAFRTRCDMSHFNRDDSLVYPGQVGRAHLHMYFGNTGSTANSTPESIRTTGNSTCRGGIANRSTYWVPAVIDTASGNVMRMMYADVYYKTGYLGVRNEDVKPIPQGLRMIAGDMTRSTAPPTLTTAKRAASSCEKRFKYCEISLALPMLDSNRTMVWRVCGSCTACELRIGVTVNELFDQC